MDRATTRVSVGWMAFITEAIGRFAEPGRREWALLLLLATAAAVFEFEAVTVDLPTDAPVIFLCAYVPAAVAATYALMRRMMRLPDGSPTSAVAFVVATLGQAAQILVPLALVALMGRDSDATVGIGLVILQMAGVVLFVLLLPWPGAALVRGLVPPWRVVRATGGIRFGLTAGFCLLGIGRSLPAPRAGEPIASNALLAVSSAAGTAMQLAFYAAVASAAWHFARLNDSALDQ